MTTLPKRVDPLVTAKWQRRGCSAVIWSDIQENVGTDGITYTPQLDWTICELFKTQLGNDSFEFDSSIKRTEPKLQF